MKVRIVVKNCKTRGLREKSTAYDLGMKLMTRSVALTIRALGNSKNRNLFQHKTYN